MKTSTTRTIGMTLALGSLLLLPLASCGEAKTESPDSLQMPESQIDAQELKKQFQKEAQETINESNMEEELRALENEINADDG